jgi:hypothetical protein
VDLDRAHADPEIVSDQLVRPACQQPIKNLPLARTESCESPDGVGDIVVAIVLVPRATSSHHTRATSSESAQGDRSQGASAALRLSTAKLLGQFDHLASVVSLIDFAKALAPDLRAGGALAVTGSFQLDEGLPALTTVNATSAMAA